MHVACVQESLPVDEVESFTRRRTKVIDDEIYRTCVTADISVERTRPDLSVWRQVVRYATDVER